MKRTLSHARLTLLLLAALVVPGTAGALVPDTDSLQSGIRTRVTIQTDIDSALVIVDGVRVGVTPLTIDSMSAGMHFLRLQHPDLPNWLTGSITDSIQLAPGESRTLRYMIGHQSFVISHPFGADVFLGDSLYGSTPLILAQDQASNAATLTIRKEGFEPVTTHLTNVHRGILSIRLTPLWQKEGIASPVFDGSEGDASKNLRLYVTGASTVLSGIAAAYLKTKADDRYSDYSRTGDPSLLSQTHRLDTAAGIALAVTQVGLGLFTYFILSE